MIDGHPTHRATLAEFDYDLPQELIAQRPVEPRDASRLLVVERDGGRIRDRVFRDLPALLEPGDLIVVNNTRVFNARMMARRRTGGAVEMLLLEHLGSGRWTALARPARRLRDGERLVVVDRDGEPTTWEATVLGRRDDLFEVDVPPDAVDIAGRAPLPPYITEPLDDGSRYQTVYADAAGSAAAPTAGLHFTRELMERCEAVGADFHTVTLHVGLDTFQPIKVHDVSQHRMHSEWFSVGDPGPIREAHEQGRRVIAVGTTTVRTLEAAASEILDPAIAGPIQGRTRLFITPGHRFQLVDAMVTNFHLPRTTLMLLVSAFGGTDLIRAAYEHAIHERYRFYSFGDAMFIV